MFRVKLGQSVSKNILILSVLAFLYPLLVKQTFAQSKFPAEPISPRYLYWSAMISLSFVQGALNGQFILILRRYKYDYSGYRWTEAFWSAFPLAFMTTLLIQGMMETLHGSDTIHEASRGLFSFAIVCFFVINFLLSFVLGRWAAKE